MPAESPSLDVHMLDPESGTWEAVATTSVRTDPAGGGPMTRGCHAAAGKRGLVHYS
jgi:hypothetical protein